MEAAVVEADRVLGDRTRFALAEEAWTRFVAVLDGPPQENPGLAKLFSKPSVFDQSMTYRRPEPLGRHHEFDDFDCGEQARDEWLEKHARAEERLMWHVGLSSRRTTMPRRWLAITLSQPPRSSRQTLPSGREKGQPSLLPVPAVLLARLAVDRRHQGDGLGWSLLQDVVLRCVATADAIGVRVLLVHATNERARAWYEQYGFEESPTDPLHRVLMMKDARSFVERYASVSDE